MKKISILLTIGAALLLSPLCFDLSHAVQIDRTKQYGHTRMAGVTNEPATAPTTQVSTAPIPCRGDGMRRTGGPCVGAELTNATRYTMIAITTSAIFALVGLLLSMYLPHRIPHPPLVKSTQ